MKEKKRCDFIFQYSIFVIALGFIVFLLLFFEAISNQNVYSISATVLIAFSVTLTIIDVIKEKRRSARNRKTNGHKKNDLK